MAIGNIEPMIYGNRAAPAADPEQERVVAAQAGLIVNEAEPLNCETPPLGLGSEVTPTARFYRRNHFPIPVLDETTWRERVAAWPWFLAWRDGEPVGLVAVVTEQPGGASGWHLISMWVSPQVRGSGVADGLVAAVTAHARAAGVSTVTLWVAARNDRARGFYERMGFRPTGVRQTYQRDDAPDLDEEELTLDLAGPG